MSKIDVNKMINNENFKTIGKIAKAGCTFAARSLVLVLSYTSAKDIIETIRYSGKVGYNDAVSAIMSSSMFSSNKNEAVSALKKDGDSELYKAVIHVVRSNMLSSNKVETIKNICQD